MSFVAVGDNCADYYTMEKKAYAGGCSLNFSVYIKELGGEAAYVGAVGEDAFGRLIRRALKSHGVDDSHVHVLKGKTAVTSVRLVDKERFFEKYEEGVLKDFKLGREDLEFISRFDYMHTSVYGGIDGFLEEIAGKTAICYDFADKFTETAFRAILEKVEFAFFSCHAACREEEEAAKALLHRACQGGPRCAVATLGEHGSLACDGSRFYRLEGRSAEVVDTIGAGDSFIAGFMYGISRNMPIRECLFAGARRAEETISYYGAFRNAE